MRFPYGEVGFQLQNVNFLKFCANKYENFLPDIVAELQYIPSLDVEHLKTDIISSFETTKFTLVDKEIHLAHVSSEL